MFASASPSGRDPGDGTNSPPRGGDGDRRRAPSRSFAGSDDLADAQAFWTPIARYAPSALIAPIPGLSLAVVISGWACELRDLADGRRQIFAFLLPGDRVLLPAQAAGSASLRALTRVELGAGASAPSASATEEAAGLTGALFDQRARLLNHILRLGALNALARTAHLILELHQRLAAVRLATADAYRLPLTQDVFAEALGLSVVHVNRTLATLRRAGLISLHAGRVTIHDFEGLKTLSINA